MYKKGANTQSRTTQVLAGVCEIVITVPVIPSYPRWPPDSPISATNVAFMFLTSKVCWGKGHEGGVGQDRAAQFLAGVLPNWKRV